MIATTIIRNGKETPVGSRNRQAAFRQKQEERGLAQASGWAPKRAIADLIYLMKALADNPQLELLMVARDTETGKFVSLSNTEADD